MSELLCTKDVLELLDRIVPRRLMVHNYSNKRRCPTLIFAVESMPKTSKSKQWADGAASYLIAELDTMIELLNCDCMEYMATVPDKYFDLAIVDPPYGIDIAEKLANGWVSKAGGTKFEAKDWDKYTPTQEYWDELFRVSKNQIVWGGNYFMSKIQRDSPCWIFWDKNNGDSLFADGEMAWTSFDSPVRLAKIHWCGSAAKHETGQNKIHPTQKPIKLYEWILHRYANIDMKILDTHLGSGSSAIAAHYFGVDFVGCELDKDYFEAAKARFDMATKQLAMSI